MSIPFSIEIKTCPIAPQPVKGGGEPLTPLFEYVYTILEPDYDTYLVAQAWNRDKYYPGKRKNRKA
jgi:hypothetical protein